MVRGGVICRSNWMEYPGSPGVGKWEVQVYGKCVWEMEKGKSVCMSVCLYLCMCVGRRFRMLMLSPTPPVTQVADFFFFSTWKRFICVFNNKKALGDLN